MHAGRASGFVLLLMLSVLLSFVPFVWDLGSPVKIIGAVMIAVGFGWVIKEAVS
ncbi:MAG: hypothetical protein KAW41_06865 [Candidatus Diapherotrites archaeon]|nr:hypothetical protein [Candidatus Diapherotrites archaeon]